MADESGIAEVIKNIQADVSTIVRGEIELAKAELIPQAKAAGLGAGPVSYTHLDVYKRQAPHR